MITFNTVYFDNTMCLRIADYVILNTRTAIMLSVFKY